MLAASPESVNVKWAVVPISLAIDRIRRVRTRAARRYSTAGTNYMDSMVQAKRVEIRLGPGLLADTDAWRRDVPDIPPRAEAIVRLVELGLEAAAKKKAKPAPK